MLWRLRRLPLSRRAARVDLSHKGRGNIGAQVSTNPLFPIAEVLPELLTRLQAHPRLVLEAPPGAGKTTQVPPALLDAPWLAGRKILMLEPRRIAARAAAEFMAETQEELKNVLKTLAAAPNGGARLSDELRGELRLLSRTIAAAVDGKRASVS